MAKVEISKNKLWALYGVWVIPVAHFVIQPSYEPLAWLAWLALVVTFVLCSVEARLFPYAIPFAAMLSPLAGTTKLAGLLPSEMFLVYSAMCWILLAIRRGTRNSKLMPGDTYLLLLVLLAAISYVQSLEYIALLPALLNWVALIIVFVVTRESINSPASIRSYFRTLWVVAAYVCAVIVAGYLNELTLAYWMSDVEKVDHSRDALEYLFRASYFYTNVIYVLGAAASALAVTIFMTDKTIHKIAATVFLLGIVGTLLIMFNKTALVALAVGLFIVGIVSLLARQSGNRRKGVSHYVTLVFLSGATAIIVFKIVGNLDKYDMDFWQTFVARVVVASSVLSVMWWEPERLLFGFGPDASLRLENATIDAARWSGLAVEGAIDSAYMTFLFEYGVFFFGLVVLFGCHTLLRLFRLMKYHNGTRTNAMLIFAVVTFCYIAFIGQVIGTSKVAWIVMQVFTLAGVCANNANRSSRVVSRIFTNYATPG